MIPEEHGIRGPNFYENAKAAEADIQVLTLRALEQVDLTGGSCGLNLAENCTLATECLEGLQCVEGRYYYRKTSLREHRLPDRPLPVPCWK